MKRILKVISKLGVLTMISTSFIYTLKSNTDDISGAILFAIGWFCASYYFIFEEE